MTTPEVQKITIGRLVPSPRNARTHSKRQVRQIARSIERFGFTNPVLIDDENRIVAGHGRVAAAEHLGLAEVPILRLSGLSEGELRAYALADNRLAEDAGWDRKLLALELQYIEELDIDIDLTVTGFEAAEIDILMDELVIGEDDDAPDPLDHIAAPDHNVPIISKTGDLWQLGDHRLVCGDMRDAGLLVQLMAGDAASAVFTDPPYNVAIDGHVSGLGRHHHREFQMASGEMSEAEFIGFLTDALEAMAEVCVDGAILFVCMDWRHLHEMLTAIRRARLVYLNLCVWSKSNAGMGSLYRSQHELVVVLKKGRAAHVNNVELGRHGRHRSNIWRYPGANSFGSNRERGLAMHPTVKPVAMVADAIKDVSGRGDIVLDPFAGSGSTIIAAEKTGRCCRAVEIDPVYVDVAIRRWQQLTGKTAIHEDTGKSLEALAGLRERESANAA